MSFNAARPEFPTTLIRNSQDIEGDIAARPGMSSSGVAVGLARAGRPRPSGTPEEPCEHLADMVLAAPKKTASTRTISTFSSIRSQ
jgi:hypothetical protein